MLSKRKYLFGTTVLVGLLAATAPAFAQTAADGAPPQDEEEAVVDEIVVTGSRIRRDPTNSPTPLIQVTREALLETGRTTVIDYLAQLPSLSNSVIPSDTTGAGLGDGGLSLANLRSLGTDRTLTLIDGRRQVGSAGGSLAVDVDSVPRLLIENIEIITGGAAAVYGADAVSGVLNFILRKDFEGLEIDANWAQTVQGGASQSRRVSALAGKNFFDDRLNVYVFGEYDEFDDINVFDIDWLADSWGLVGLDADPTSLAIGPNTDERIDSGLFSGLRTLQRPRWGQTTLANNQQPSPAINPNVPFLNPQCTRTLNAAGTAFAPLGNQINNANCYSIDPAKTWVFEGTTARLANFGQRIGNLGANRTLNIGGDGENPAQFGQITRFPRSESSRYQVGSTLKVTSNITATLEAKYVDESTFDIAQPAFYDFYLSDRLPATSQAGALATNLFELRLSDTAYLPSNLRAAIQANTLTTYSPAPTAAGQTGNPGAVIATNVAAPFARHTLFSEDRTQDNQREVTRYVGSLTGIYDQVAFIKNFTWDVAYVYGESENVNREVASDQQRVYLAADAVVDTAGVVNGRPGEVVCRSRLFAAQGRVVADSFRGGALVDTEAGAAALAQCVPLNIFGAGNQSAEALQYIGADVNPRQFNEQEQAVASISGQLWDFWGAGPLGVAVGAEYRREFTSRIGRDADVEGRFLFLNAGPDFPAAEYDSTEYFAEISIPLLQDSFLGEYAELSGSYRTAEYSTVGEQEVYGVNLVYRPIQDIAFKSSLNTSIRVPNLFENFAPFSQTFSNGFADPCTTAAINAPTLRADFRTNRIANCTELARQQGLTFDFAGSTPQQTDDFVPNYTSGIAGVSGGNQFLLPEESESFTFSTVLQPRWIPDLSIVLDYYEIEITNVIAGVGAPVAAANCVNGPTLNAAACATIFRNNPNIPFGVGAPDGDPIGGFIQGSINYAKLETRGLDFSVNYGFDIAEKFGPNLGYVNFSMGGLWLIEQKQFLNTNDESFFDELSGGTSYPRVRLNTTVRYAPSDTFSVTWQMNWQTAQDVITRRDFILNADSRSSDFLDTGNFAVHDFSVRWNVRDDLELRTTLTNAFDAEQPRFLGTGFLDNYDPYGTRLSVGLTFRPF